MALAVIGGIALLGNGLKAFVTSTVLVSEASFASFLGIPVERVALLMQTIVAGMVVALAVYPLLLHRLPVRTIAIAGCAIAAAAFAAFAVADLTRPSPGTREVAAYAFLTAGAAALACLAPASQALIARWPAPAGRKVLTTIWTAATPIGFLAAPQLAKWLLPALGLGAYFAGFAALPLVLLALVLAATALRDRSAAQGSLPPALLAAFVVAVLAFELWSTAGSLTGYLTPVALLSLVLVVATLGWLAACVRRSPRAGDIPRATWGLVVALFLLQLPTTGFFEAAFLFDRGMPPGLVADRATLAAAAQIAGTFGAGVLVHRAPAIVARLPMLFAAVAIAGVASYAAYPLAPAPAYYLATAAVTGVGCGGLTLLLCVAVVHDAVDAPMIAALPSIAIMVGTEVGLEVLQVVYAAAQGAGLAEEAAFGALFLAQAALALTVPVALSAARRAALRSDPART